MQTFGWLEIPHFLTEIPSAFSHEIRKYVSNNITYQHTICLLRQFLFMQEPLFVRRCLADQSHDRLDGVCDLAVLHGIDISVLFVEDMVDGFQQSGVGQLLLLKNITESLGTERVGV